MTGPEHYREAERLIRLNDTEASQPGGIEKDRAFLRIDTAQVHATLALAAATVDGDTLHRTAWQGVLT